MQRSRSRKLEKARANAHGPVHGRRAMPPLLRRAPMCAAIMAAMQGAHAQDENATPSGGLEEVVVTASKRSENLQDVPISITAMDSQKLDQLNVHDFNDYAQ